METTLLSRLKVAVERLEVISAYGSLPSSPATNTDMEAPVDAAISAFDNLVAKSVGRLRDAAESIGGGVVDMTKIVEEAFAVEKELLIEIKKCKKPDIAGLREFLKPLNEVIMGASTMIEGRRPDFFNHLKAAADSLTALLWIAYSGKDCGMCPPVSHVEGSWQMAEFYNNKVLIEYRTRDPDHVEWARALKGLYLPGLRDFVKEFYPLGPVWSSTSKSCPLKTLPPLPSGSLFDAEATVSSSKEAVLASSKETSSSKSATSGLRRATNYTKTKKRADRIRAVTPSKEDAQGSSFPLKPGPQKFELQMGRKWAVEFQIGKKNLVIKDCNPKQSLYVFGCTDSILHVKGKVNNIIIDKCTKMGVIFMDVVVACEMINCNIVEIICQGSAPSISVDNTAGCRLYLSKDSLGVSITTSKSSKIDVMIPGSDADSNWVEHPLPHRFIHVFKDGRFLTTPTAHPGS